MITRKTGLSMDIKSVKNKISLGVGGCVLLTALVIIWYTVAALRTSAGRESSERSLGITRTMVATLENRVNRELQMVQTLAQTLAAAKSDTVKLDLDRNRVKGLLQVILEENPQIVGIFTCWEPDAFDGKDENGRFALHLSRNESGQVEASTLLDLPGRSQDGKPGAWYGEPKRTKKSYVSDPFAVGGKDGQRLLVSLTAPVIAQGGFAGVVGLDLDTEFIQRAVDGLRQEGTEITASFISYNGIIAAVTGRPELAGQHLKELHADYEEDLVHIQSGEEISTLMDKDMETYVPITFGESERPWAANIIVPTGTMTAEATSILWKMILIGAGCVALAFYVLRRITASAVGPLDKVADLAADLAEGDLSKRLNINRDDEIGALAAALDQSCASLSGMIQEITTNAEMQASAAQQMSSVSAQLAATAEEMNVQAESVAGATEEMSVSINAMASASEEMSVNIQTVSSTAEQMSQNMNSIASSVEQMSTSIEDVALNAKDGSVIARQAMEMSGTATKIMDVLGKAAREIGEVTSLIKRIADQTNLLALNATIEAASAGDAGKGFAVVANEIKELANQSGQAANEIAKRVKGVQGNASSAVEAISTITEIIARMNDSSNVISKSVEEQTSTALEISDSVQQATAGISNIATSIAELARGANDVSKSAAEAARGVTEVSANIQGLSRAASESNSGAQQVNQTAAELARISDQLREVAARFKILGK